MAIPPELSNAPIREKGRYFEDFRVGQVLHHHWGRTFTQTDNLIFSSVTLSYHPIYFNAEYAKAIGRDGVVNPVMVFCTVLGLSVEDLSEKGGAFLGVDDLVYHRPVLIGETLHARSKVLEVRASSSRPTQGIVRWHTDAYVKGPDGGEVVLDYVRANLLPRRELGR